MVSNKREFSCSDAKFCVTTGKLKKESFFDLFIEEVYTFHYKPGGLKPKWLKRDA